MIHPNQIAECMNLFDVAIRRSEAQEAQSRKKVAGSYQKALAGHLSACEQCSGQQVMCMVGQCLAAGAAKEVIKDNLG